MSQTIALPKGSIFSEIAQLAPLCKGSCQPQRLTEGLSTTQHKPEGAHSPRPMLDGQPLRHCVPPPLTQGRLPGSAKSSPWRTRPRAQRKTKEPRSAAWFFSTESGRSLLRPSRRRQRQQHGVDLQPPKEHGDGQDELGNGVVIGVVGRRPCDAEAGADIVERGEHSRQRR